MTKYLNKKRIKILERARKNIINRTNRCICIAITHDKTCLEILWITQVLDIFPELLKYKPKGKETDERWWPLNYIKVRLNVIDKVITDIKAQMK